MSTDRTDTDSESQTQWDAYSDYQLVSQRVAKSIEDANDAYAIIESGLKSGAKIDSYQETELRADILGAAMRLRVELENERDKRPVYDDILSDWEGEDGYIARFRRMDLQYDAQGEWLAEFILQIRRAGWELGYLKAGREEKHDDPGGSDDSDILELFEEMKL